MNWFFPDGVRQKAAKRAVALGLGSTLSLSLPVAEASFPSKTSPEPHSHTGPLNNIQTDVSSWVSCISAAEQDRSERDLKFFTGAKSLSNAKSGFGAHSINNEQRFCRAIGRCEARFGLTYKPEVNSYQACSTT